MIDLIKSEIKKSIDVKVEILESNELVKTICKCTEIITEAYRRGNKVLIAGNGGSAADAQHIAGELVSRFYFDRPGLPAISLTTDTSILTAVGNDYGFERLFERQIQANGVEGDIFIGISTSGNSPNILNAFNECSKKGIISMGLTGKNGGKMQDKCNYCIKVPSDITPRIQESHIMIGHIICALVEKQIFGRG